MFTQPMLLACLALVASLILTARHRPVVFPVLAVVVSALEILMSFGLVHMSVARLPLGLIFGAVLVLSGVVVYAKTQARSTVAAATTVILVGALQILASLHLH
jgi:hypothetical protein